MNSLRRDASCSAVSTLAPLSDTACRLRVASPISSLMLPSAVVSLVGKKRVQEATPAKPERAMDNVKQDIAEVKGAAQS